MIAQDVEHNLLLQLLRKSKNMTRLTFALSKQFPSAYRTLFSLACHSSLDAVCKQPKK